MYIIISDDNTMLRTNKKHIERYSLFFSFVVIISYVSESHSSIDKHCQSVRRHFQHGHHVRTRTNF
jgi:hypothetical protein